MSYQDTTAQWEAELAEGIHWREAYAFVATRAKTLLLSIPGHISTNALVSALYTGNDHYTRQRVYKALGAQATHSLAGWWQDGHPEVRRVMGRDQTVTPRIWRAPPAKKCPHCGGEL